MLYILALVFGIILLANPFLGVCLSILLDFIASSYSVGPVPMRNYLVPVLLFFMVTLIAIKQRVPALNKYVLKIIGVAVVFIFLGTFCRLMHEEPLWAFIGRVIVPFFIMCYCAYFTDNLKLFRIFLYCIGIGMAISACVGIFQFIGMDWAWNLNLALNPVPVTDAYETSDTYLRLRIVGLASFSIPLAYSLCAFTPFMLSVSYVKVVLSKFDKAFFTSVFVLSAIAMLLSLSRSAIMGIGLGVLVVLLNRSESKKKIWIAMFLGLITLLVFLIPEVNDRMRRGTESDRGTMARAVLGINMAIDNPLGTGGGSSRAFQDSFVKYFGEIYDMEGAQSTNIESSHNQFINIAIYYGYLGLILLCLLYFYVFSLTHLLKKQAANDFIYSCAVGVEASVLAYCANSMFHNAGPFLGEVYFWYLMAILLVITQINSNLCQKSA